MNFQVVSPVILFQIIEIRVRTQENIFFHLVTFIYDSASTTKPCSLLWAQIPRSNVGQVAHESPTHLKSLRKKLTSRVAPLRRLAGYDWGAGETTLCTATVALVHSTAAYCTPVWCRSAHTRLIDPAVNETSSIVTGCWRSTAADNCPILSGTKPAAVRRSGATLSLGRRAMEPGDLLHSALTRPSSAVARRLKSRHPFLPAAQQLFSFSDNNNIRPAQWADHKWNAEWEENPTKFRTFIPETGIQPRNDPPKKSLGPA